MPSGKHGPNRKPQTQPRQKRPISAEYTAHTRREEDYLAPYQILSGATYVRKQATAHVRSTPKSPPLPPPTRADLIHPHNAHLASRKHSSQALTDRPAYFSSGGGGRGACHAHIAWASTYPRETATVKCPSHAQRNGLANRPISPAVNNSGHERMVQKTTELQGVITRSTLRRPPTAHLALVMKVRPTSKSSATLKTLNNITQL